MDSAAHLTDRFPMDTSTASEIQSAKIGQAIDTAVAKKSLDMQKMQGQAALALLDQATQIAQTPAANAMPGVGQNLDVTC